MKSVPALGAISGRDVVVGLMLVLLGLAGPSSQAQDPPSAITAFFNAIKANDTNGVAQMLASNTNLTRARYVSRLPLHVAASQGHGEIVALLLK